MKKNFFIHRKERAEVQSATWLVAREVSRESGLPQHVYRNDRKSGMQNINRRRYKVGNCIGRNS